MMTKNKVVIGLLGSKLDTGKDGLWRPTLALCLQDGLVFNRLDLLYQKAHYHRAVALIQDINKVAPQTEVKMHEIPLKHPWDFEENYSVLLDFASNYQFNLEKEEYYVHISTGTHVAQICLFMLTNARFIPGHLIQTSKNDKDPKDIKGIHYVIDLNLSRYEQIAVKFQLQQQQNVSSLKGGISTKNKAFNEMIDEIEIVAISSSEPILLTGSTGVGKSRLAGLIYKLKKEKKQLTGEFIEVNCATIQGDGAMSILFGHIKGAYTGANTSRKGLLKSAHGGLLFLDEIACLGHNEQAMLLRAIEEKKFRLMGSDKEETSDFQLIAGTNKDLLEMVRSGSFREDLLARIDCWNFKLPSLRERLNDLEPNINFELENITKRLDKKRALWTHNFRDLNKSVTRMATLADGRITENTVKREIERLCLGWYSNQPKTNCPLSQLLDIEQINSLDLFDQIQLEQVIKICYESKSISEAGRKLFCHTRTQRKVTNDSDRLIKYFNRYKINWKILFDHS
ncbi:MAG: transcriptional regulatory protein RtcR [bacterium]|nr:MAG: transcriptional regulatory protein RtcR [bacterium]